jgi:hypothetical protein
MSLTRVELIEHGTAPGFDAHKRRGEDACAACKQAHANRSAAHRIRRGEQQTVRVSAVELGELLIASDEEVCHRFGEVFGHDIVAACMDRAAADAWAESRSA